MDFRKLYDATAYTTNDNTYWSTSCIHIWYHEFNFRLSPSTNKLGYNSLYNIRLYFHMYTSTVWSQTCTVILLRNVGLCGTSWPHMWGIFKDGYKSPRSPCFSRCFSMTSTSHFNHRHDHTKTNNTYKTFTSHLTSAKFIVLLVSNRIDQKGNF
jgi:hypothetical protein